jgi:hypothetical protein
MAQRRSFLGACGVGGQPPFNPIVSGVVGWPGSSTIIPSRSCLVTQYHPRHQSPDPQRALVVAQFAREVIGERARDKSPG